MARSSGVRVRRGRPPASSAEDTRQRIISVAATLFSDHGYGVTTNKDVALQAGISTGALYYYFESKLDMYLAVFHEHQARIDERMNQVMESESTFAGRLRGILEAAHELNLENPFLARFQSAARIDRKRHPELYDALPNPPGEGARLMGRLIGDGVDQGEIDPLRREQATAAVRVILVGLVESASSDPNTHNLAIQGIKSLLDSELIRQPDRRMRTGDIIEAAGPGLGTSRGDTE